MFNHDSLGNLPKSEGGWHPSPHRQKSNVGGGVMSERSGAGKGRGKEKAMDKTEARKWDAVGRTVLGEEPAYEMVCRMRRSQ